MGDYNFYIRSKSAANLRTLTTKTFFLEHSLSAQIYEEATLVPADMSKVDFHRGIVDNNGHVIKDSMLQETWSIDWANNVDLSQSVYVDKTAIYIGWMECVWGHVITDDIKKLWYLETEECKELIRNGAELVCILPYNYKPLEEFINLLGFNWSSIRCVNHQVRYKHVVIPQNSIISNKHGLFFTREYLNLINRVRVSIPRLTNVGKLYYSRTKFTKESRWREFGEKAIEDQFRKRGYKIVYPEELNMMESLSLLANCSEFVSTEGSISHNIIFCKRDTNVVLLRKIDYVNTWQLIINEMSGCRITYVDVHQSIVSKGCYGPFYLCITPELQKYFGKKILHIPHMIRPSFWWYLVQNRKITKRLFKILGIEKA